MYLRNILVSLVIAILFLALYLSTQSHSIFGGDAGDLVSAASTLGVAHPPGYPLYTVVANMLIKYVNYGTPAWRVSLLSSISIAVSMGMVTLLGLLLFNRVIPAVLGSLILGLTYIYWLYAIVPEVFGMHLFFMTTQLVVLRLWEMTRQKKWITLFVGLFTLSILHHQIILFVLPAYMYFFLTHKNQLKIYLKSNRKQAILASILALAPLAYFAVSIPRLAPYTWADTSSISEVIKIITRDTYGSFTSAHIILEKPLARLTDVYAYFVFMIEDFGLLGFMLIIIGAAYLYFVNKRYFVFSALIFLFTGPLFVFYGAYILSNNFTIATFERFLLPSYIAVTVWLVSGIYACSYGLDNLIAYIRRQQKSHTSFRYAPIILAAVAVLPTHLLISNYPKMSILTHDTTAEHFAEDILNTADKNAILLLTNDNEAFNAAYLYYSLKKRPDIAFFNTSRLLDGKTIKQYVKAYPDIHFPNENDPKFVEKFLVENVKLRPIYTNEPFKTDTEYLWIREGVLTRLYHKSNIPSSDMLLEKNNNLWNSYHDPFDGALGYYNHLMLSTNLLTWRIYRAGTGDYFFAAKKFAGAEAHYREALRYNNDDINIYHRLAATLIEQNKCKEAENELSNIYKSNPENISTHLLFIKLYTDCEKNAEKVKTWKSLYESVVNKNQTLLKNL